MKVLLFNWRSAAHPEAGGAERFLHATAGRWADQGHEIALICAYPPGNSSREEWRDGVRIVHVGNRVTLYPAAASEYKRRWRGWPDVVVEHINGIPFFTPLYVEEPLVTVLHHFVGSVFFRELGVPLGLLCYALERTIPFVYRDVPLVTVSPSTRGEAIRRGFPRPRVNVVYNGVDDPSPPLPMARDDNRVLYLGRLKRYKRLDLLVRAAREVLREVSDATFVVAGRGNYESELRYLIKHFGLQQSFELPGFVNETQKESLFRTSKILIYPSEREGWGVTILEAASYGVPTVAFDVPGVRDAIVPGQTGILVPPRDFHALANEAVGLLRDEDRRRKIGARAMHFSSRFCWDQAADTLLSHLEAVASTMSEKG